MTRAVTDAVQAQFNENIREYFCMRSRIVFRLTEIVGRKLRDISATVQIGFQLRNRTDGFPALVVLHTDSFVLFKD